MLAIRSSEIPAEAVSHNELRCNAIDATSAQHEDSDGCLLSVEYAIFVQPAEDMLVPMFLCRLHYNAFKLAAREGVGLGQGLLKEIEEKL